MFWTGEKHRDGTDPSHGNAPRARAVGDSAGVPFTLSISLSAPVDGRAQLTARSRRCFCSKARLLDRRFANATNSGSSVEFCQIQSVCRVIARRRARSSFLRYFQRIFFHCFLLRHGFFCPRYRSSYPAGRRQLYRRP